MVKGKNENSIVQDVTVIVPFSKRITVYYCNELTFLCKKPLKAVKKGLKWHKNLLQKTKVKSTSSAVSLDLKRSK